MDFKLFEERVCFICGKRGFYTEIGNLCKDHFMKVLEKKFRSTFRKYNFFEKGSSIFIKYKNNIGKNFSEVILDKFSRVFPLEIVNDENSADYIVIVDFLEDFCSRLIKSFLFSDEKYILENFIKKGNLCKPFFNISIFDAARYLFLLGFKKIEEDVKKILSDPIIRYIEYVSNGKQTQKYSMLSSSLFFYEILNEEKS